MKIIGNTLEKTFLVKYHGKEYYITYLDSDYHNPILMNHLKWEVFDENGEEITIYCLKSFNKKDRQQIKSNNIKAERLIRFCIKHFYSYRPNYSK